MQVEFNNLLDQVRRTQDPKEATMRLFQGIAQMFTAAKDDPAKIEEVSKNVHAHAEAFSKAVVTRLPGANGESQPAGQTTINQPTGAEPLPAGRSTHEPVSTAKHSSHAPESKSSATKGK